MSKNVKCEICGEEHKLQGFHWHLKKHGITKQQYIDQYGEIKAIDAPERAVETVTNDTEVNGVNLENVDKIADELDERVEKTGSILKSVEAKVIEVVKENDNREINENNLEEKNMKEKSVMKGVSGNLEMLKQGLSLTALYVDEYGSVRDMREVIAIARDENGDYTTMVLDNDGVLVPPVSIENYYAIIKGEGKVLQKNIKLLMGKPIRVQPGPGKPIPARVSAKKGMFGRRSKKQGKHEGINKEEAEDFYKEVAELTNE
jgi:hypothetical protein